MTMDIQRKTTILYKYRHFDPSGHSLRIISRSELWFSCAKFFNDPFDTAFTYDFDGLYTELAERWARNAVNRYNPELPETEREILARQRLTRIRNDTAYQNGKQEEFVESNYQTFGICSLAGSKDNLLLWAHYAEQHTGFCVGLSVSDLNNIANSLAKGRDVLEIIPVKYSTETPHPNFFESMLNEDTSHITDFIATKSTHWRYEEEQRLVFWQNVNKSFLVGYPTIREVILG